MVKFEKITKLLEETSLYELPIFIHQMYKDNEYSYTEEGEKRINNGIIPEFIFKAGNENRDERKFPIDFSDLEIALVEILRLASIFGSFFVKPNIKVYFEGNLVEEKEYPELTINSISELLKERIKHIKEMA